MREPTNDNLYTGTLNTEKEHTAGDLDFGRVFLTWFQFVPQVSLPEKNLHS